MKWASENNSDKYKNNVTFCVLTELKYSAILYPNAWWISYWSSEDNSGHGNDLYISNGQFYMPCHTVKIKL